MAIVVEPVGVDPDPDPTFKKNRTQLRIRNPAGNPFEGKNAGKKDAIFRQILRTVGN